MNYWAEEADKEMNLHLGYFNTLEGCIERLIKNEETTEKPIDVSKITIDGLKNLDSYATTKLNFLNYHYIIGNTNSDLDCETVAFELAKQLRRKNLMNI